ncbi:GNAT family N-acetyltransferase [Photobacterium sp. MCCC 1A19761]|uniref:GNAT family N-acetyltransferase n=1 Tax=Photobacterium sp. MCCC 1A19761 TaxID=3115000 RepID=UPI00307D7D2C
MAREATSGTPIGFMAANERCISQLYIHVAHQHRGIGSALMAIAKQGSSGGLQLRMFEVNPNAQRFYEHHGFRAINGDSNNEEGLPDMLYEWRASEGT